MLPNRREGCSLLIKKIFKEKLISRQKCYCKIDINLGDNKITTVIPVIKYLVGKTKVKGKILQKLKTKLLYRRNSYEVKWQGHTIRGY
jgi:hypothetical protein